MKTLWIITITLSLCAAFFYLGYNHLKAEPELFLIPSNYQGEVLVIFEQNNGAEIEYNGKTRIYRIPDSGVLFTQFEYNPGFVEHEYYYVNENGDKEQIEYRPFMDERDKYKNQPDRVGMTRKIAEFYGTDSCQLKTIQLIVSSHKNYNNYSCYRRMLEITDTICN